VRLKGPASFWHLGPSPFSEGEQSLKSSCGEGGLFRTYPKHNSSSNSKFSCDLVVVASAVLVLEDEVPFARCVREQEKVFRGGKFDG
jgi:hypothetical protein